MVRSCVAEGAEAGAAHAEGAPEQGIVGACTCAARSKMYIVHATRGMQVTLWWLQKRKKNQTHAPSSRRFPENLFSQHFFAVAFRNRLKESWRN